MGAFIVWAFIGLGLFAFFMLIRSTEKTKRKKEAMLVKYSSLYHGVMKHFEGLPLASGVDVEVFYGREKITFKKEQQEISLECNRIVDIDTVFGKDVASQASTGAIAGKMIVGGVGGAVIGALAASTMYFILTYTNGEEQKYILLDIAMSGSLSSKIAKDFKANNQRDTIKIEL